MPKIEQTYWLELTEAQILAVYAALQERWQELAYGYAGHHAMMPGGGITTIRSASHRERFDIENTIADIEHAYPGIDEVAL